LMYELVLINSTIKQLWCRATFYKPLPNSHGSVFGHGRHRLSFLSVRSNRQASGYEFACFRGGGVEKIVFIGDGLCRRNLPGHPLVSDLEISDGILGDQVL